MTVTQRNSFIVLLSLICLTTGEEKLVAQAARVAVVGTVTDSTSDRPVRGVVLQLSETGSQVLSDSAGAFRLESVSVGRHVLTITRTGYASRTLTFVVTENSRSEFDLGRLALVGSASRPVLILGSIADRSTGEPVGNVTVELNGREAAVSDSRGRFRIMGTNVEREATNRIDARRIGYEPSTEGFFVSVTDTEIRLMLGLEPAPVRLEDIEVEDEVPLTTGRMTGFFDRRARGFGHFYTRADIQRMGARDVVDVIRRVPGATIFSEENVSLDPTNPNSSNTPPLFRTSITFQRSGYSRMGTACEALIFVNDMLVNDPRIDLSVPADQIAAVEVYTSAAQIPIEYNRRGSTCGVVVLWTDAPIGRPARGRVVEVGTHFGFHLTRRGAESERIGLQLTVPLFGRVEFAPGMNIIFGSAVDAPSAGWQAFANVRIRPFGRLTPWYLGTGAALVRDRVEFSSRDLETSRTDGFHTLVTGVSLPIGPTRPFIEIQALDPFASGLDHAYAFAGFTIRGL